MSTRSTGSSPGSEARLAGAVYLLYFVAAVSGEVLLRGIVLPGNTTAAPNLLAHASRFHLGLGAELLSVVLYVALTGLFLRLFDAVSRNVSRLAACFSLVGCAILAVAGTVRLAPLFLLESQAFSTVDTQALCRLFGDLYSAGLDACFVFFGVYCLVLGYLIFRSTFLPRLLGVWMAVTGLGWMLFLYPPLAHSLHAGIIGNGFLCEVTLMLWLLIAGVNETQWRKQLQEDL